MKHQITHTTCKNIKSCILSYRTVTDIVRYFDNPLRIKQHKCVSFTYLCFLHNKSQNDISIYIDPVPKLSRTPGQLPDVIKDLHPGEHSIEVLQEAGYPQKVCIYLKNYLKYKYTPQEIKQLMSNGVVVQYKEESKL